MICMEMKDSSKSSKDRMQDSNKEIFNSTLTTSSRVEEVDSTSADSKAVNNKRRKNPDKTSLRKVM